MPLDCSVIIPVYNTQSDWLEKCLQSVINQEGVEFEIVVVNDGSDNPETINTLHAYEHRKMIRLYSTEHNGVGIALSLAVSMSSSCIIARMDSDDIMPADRLVQQVDFLRRHPEIDLLSGQMKWIDENENPSEKGQIFQDGEILEPYWDAGWRICHPTVAARKAPIIESGNYRDTRPEDLDLWCRMSWNGYRMYIERGCWNNYRNHPGQISLSEGQADYVQATITYYQNQAVKTGWTRPVRKNHA